jgi:hypothetical protein
MARGVTSTTATATRATHTRPVADNDLREALNAVGDSGDLREALDAAAGRAAGALITELDQAAGDEAKAGPVRAASRKAATALRGLPRDVLIEIMAKVIVEFSARVT